MPIFLLSITLLPLINLKNPELLLEFISKNEGLTISEIMDFVGVSRETINSLIKKGIIKIEEQKVDRNPLALKKQKESEKLKLNNENQERRQR